MPPRRLGRTLGRANRPPCETLWFRHRGPDVINLGRLLDFFLDDELVFRQAIVGAVATTDSQGPPTPSLEGKSSFFHG